MRATLLLLIAGPAIAADGWEELLVTGEKSPWKKVDAAWVFAADAKLDSKNAKTLEAVDKDKGNVWINGPNGRLPDLLTKKNYKDCEVHIEFMIGKGSNAGIKFQGLYEIQILDKPKADKLTGNDMGGIYPRAEYQPKYHHIDEGIPPKVAAGKAPGEWQVLEATWRAPRFNDKGEKTENGRIVKATLNGQVIHENQELKTPTGANYVKKESGEGPFMLQCDHGPTAWRYVKIREMK